VRTRGRAQSDDALISIWAKVRGQVLPIGLGNLLANMLLQLSAELGPGD
jgi:hypothetical protein